MCLASEQANLAQTKVRQLEVTATIDQQIIRLEVTEPAVSLVREHQRRSAYR